MSYRIFLNHSVILYIYIWPTPKDSRFKRLKQGTVSAFSSWLRWKHNLFSMMMMLLWPCLANTVGAYCGVFLTPLFYCASCAAWETEVTLCCASRRRKRTRMEGSRVCAVGTSAPASVCMAGGMNCVPCLLTWQEMFVSIFMFTFGRVKALSHSFLDSFLS